MGNETAPSQPKTVDRAPLSSVACFIIGALAGLVALLPRFVSSLRVSLVGPGDEYRAGYATQLGQALPSNLLISLDGIIVLVGGLLAGAAAMIVARTRKLRAGTLGAGLLLVQLIDLVRAWVPWIRALG